MCQRLRRSRSPIIPPIRPIYSYLTTRLLSSTYRELLSFDSGHPYTHSTRLSGGSSFSSNFPSSFRFAFLYLLQQYYSLLQLIYTAVGHGDVIDSSAGISLLCDIFLYLHSIYKRLTRGKGLSAEEVSNFKEHTYLPTV